MEDIFYSALRASSTRTRLNGRGESESRYLRENTSLRQRRKDFEGPMRHEKENFLKHRMLDESIFPGPIWKSNRLAVVSVVKAWQLLISVIINARNNYQEKSLQIAFTLKISFNNEN